MQINVKRFWTALRHAGRTFLAGLIMAPGTSSRSGMKRALLAVKNRLGRYPRLKFRLQRIIALVPSLEARLRGMGPVVVLSETPLSALGPRALELHSQLKSAIDRCRKERR